MKDIKANPLRVTWAQDSDNKITLDDNIRAAGIFYKGPIVSNQLNAVAEDLYKSISYNQYVGGYYQPSLTYDKNQFCTLMWKQNSSVPTKLISCICRENNVLTAPVINAAVTEENGVAVYNGGSLDVEKWEIRERFPVSYQEVTYTDRDMNIPNGNGFWGSVVPHKPVDSSKPHVMQLSVNSIFNIPLVLTKGFADLITNHSTFTSADLLKAQSNLFITDPGENLDASEVIVGGSKDFSDEYKAARSAVLKDAPDSVDFDETLKLPQNPIAADLTPGQVQAFLDEQVRVVVENKKLFNDMTNKLTKLVTSADDLSFGLELIANMSPRVKKTMTETELGTLEGYFIACNAYMEEPFLNVADLYDPFLDTVLSNTLFTNTVSSSELSAKQLEIRVNTVKALLEIIKALSDDNILNSWGPILKYYASMYKTEDLLQLRRDIFKTFQGTFKDFINRITAFIPFLSQIDAKFESVNYSTWQPTSTTGKNEITQFREYMGRENIIAGFYPTLMAEQNDMLDINQYDTYWIALASKDTEFGGELVKEFSFRGKVNWVKLVWIESVSDNLWCDGTDLGEDWRTNIVGTEPDVYHTMTADMELEIKVAYTWNFNTGRYELNIDDYMNCQLNYGYINVSAAPRSVYKKPGRMVDIDDNLIAAGGYPDRNIVGLYPMAPYNKAIGADYYGLPYGLAFGVKALEPELLYGRNSIIKSEDYLTKATLDIYFAVMNIMQVKFSGISNLPSSFNFKNVYNTTTNTNTPVTMENLVVEDSMKNLFIRSIFLPVRHYGGTPILPNIGSRLNIRFKSDYIRKYFAMGTSDVNGKLMAASRHSMQLGRMNLSIWNWARNRNEIDASRFSFWLSAMYSLLIDWSVANSLNTFTELIRELDEESRNVSTSGDQNTGFNKIGASYEIFMF